ncbi:MAG: hypothetical protein ACI30W_07420, partial [Muribaculaceae bacterium]
MLRQITYLHLAAAMVALLAGCSEDTPAPDAGDDPEASLPEWYYTGGQLGTAYLTTQNAFEQPTPAVEKAGLYQSFKNGEALFEKPFMSNVGGVRGGLGPAYVRTSCVHCHPNYSHGQRVPDGTFKTTEIGNGCLLVVFNPATQGYVP